MKRAPLLALLLVGGCFDPTYNNPTCGPGESCPSGFSCESDNVCRRVGGDVDADPNAPDADPTRIDAPLLQDAPIFIDAPPGSCAAWTFTPSNAVCVDPPGNVDLILSGDFTYDTSDGTFTPNTLTAPSSIVTLSNGKPARLVNVSSLRIDVGRLLVVKGNMPVVFLVHGTATIAGTIDASAALNVPGPGGSSEQCGAANVGQDGVSLIQSGGGGGGALGSPGARAGNASGGGSGGSGGTPTSVTTLVPLQGGCMGGYGGDPTSGFAGRPGAGGGGVQISARASITVSGTIDVSGGGGDGGQVGGQNGGGGGGGSGGGLLLESPSISVAGSLCGDGGSGGEGSGGSLPGANGDDGHCGGIAVGAGGGSGGGGDGGNGGWEDFVPTSGNNGGGGGGSGGGGGAGNGLIRLRGTVSDTSTVITPNPIIVVL